MPDLKEMNLWSTFTDYLLLLDRLTIDSTAYAQLK